MKIEDMRIGQLVKICYSSEDWFLDWQHDLGPHKIVGLYKTINGLEQVTIADRDGYHFSDFSPKNFEPYNTCTDIV